MTKPQEPIGLGRVLEVNLRGGKHYEREANGIAAVADARIAATVPAMIDAAKSELRQFVVDEVAKAFTESMRHAEILAKAFAMPEIREAAAQDLAKHEAKSVGFGMKWGSARTSEMTISGTTWVSKEHLDEARREAALWKADCEAARAERDRLAIELAEEETGHEWDVDFINGKLAAVEEELETKNAELAELKAAAKESEASHQGT